MPYAPGIQDISGQLYAQGLSGMGEKLAQGLEDYAQTKQDIQAADATESAIDKLYEISGAPARTPEERAKFAKAGLSSKKALLGQYAMQLTAHQQKQANDIARQRATLDAASTNALIDERKTATEARQRQAQRQEAAGRMMEEFGGATPASEPMANEDPVLQVLPSRWTRDQAAMANEDPIEKILPSRWSQEQAAMTEQEALQEMAGPSAPPASPRQRADRLAAKYGRRVDPEDIDRMYRIADRAADDNLNWETFTTPNGNSFLARGRTTVPDPNRRAASGYSHATDILDDEGNPTGQMQAVDQVTGKTITFSRQDNSAPTAERVMDAKTGKWTGMVRVRNGKTWKYHQLNILGQENLDGANAKDAASSDTNSPGFWSKVGGLFGGAKPESGQQSAPAAAAQSAPPVPMGDAAKATQSFRPNVPVPNGKLLALHPSGKWVLIAAEDWPEAKKEGYRQ
jgi:hypothetical protein